MPGGEELRHFLDRIDESRRYTNFGPLVSALETALATRHRAPDGVLPKTVSVSNATLGLQLTLEALKLRAGGRVLVPGFTFPASVIAVQRAGLTPLICDVDEASWLLTPAIARRAMQSAHLAAVMPVSTFGCPQDCAAWDEFSVEANVPVVIDAAGAFGNQLAGRRAHFVLSLHATKTLGAGEGGALVTHDAEIAQRTRRLSNFGYDDKGTGLVIDPGTNAKLSEYHAAVALAALQRWDAKARIRKELHASYLRELLAQCPSLRQQQRPPDGVYSILSVMLPFGRNAQDAAEFLATREIETRRWYCPIIPDHPGFGGIATTEGLTVSRALGERLVGLPFHPFLRHLDVSKIVSAMESFLAS